MTNDELQEIIRRNIAEHTVLSPAIIKIEKGEKEEKGVTIDAYNQILNENKALRLLLDWAIECDSFGYDNIPEEYEKYKDEIKGMSYKEGLIYIAKQCVKGESDGRF